MTVTAQTPINPVMGNLTEAQIQLKGITTLPYCTALAGLAANHGKARAHTHKVGTCRKSAPAISCDSPKLTLPRTTLISASEASRGLCFHIQLHHIC